VSGKPENSVVCQPARQGRRCKFFGLDGPRCYTVLGEVWI
jgi:hypothetical protein